MTIRCMHSHSIDRESKVWPPQSSLEKKGPRPESRPRDYNRVEPGAARHGPLEWYRNSAISTVVFLGGFSAPFLVEGGQVSDTL